MYSKPSFSMTALANSGSLSRCATLTGTRSPTTFSDCGCIRHEPSLGRLGTLEHLNRRLIGGGGDVDQVDAGVGQHATERRALLDLQPAFTELDCRNAVPDRVILADHRTKSGQDLEREPRTILQRAAVLVRPSIGVRG